ncbi:MAG: phosphatidylserine/phosphatidylglycerophosphate/cardiolipin synthase family protein [Candidatus Hadarchaeota archaeon]
MSLTSAGVIQYITAPVYTQYPFLGSSVTRDNIYAEIVEVAPEGLDNPSISNIPDAILGLIENARTSIDMEVYTIYKYTSGPVADIVNAINRAASRGVRVRILIDNEIYTKLATESPSSRAMLDNMDAHENIELRQSGWLMHSKVVIADNEAACVSSANMSTSGMTTSRNTGVIVRGETFVRALEAVFEAGWTGNENQPGFENGWTVDWIKPVVTQIGSLNWVPQTLDVILDLVNSASKTIRIPMYVISGSPSQLTNTVENAGARGVDVKIMVDRDYSNLSEYPVLLRLDQSPNTEVKYAGLSNYGVYHSKTAVADGARAYVGSANWTSTSMTSRREIGVYFEDGTLASAIENMFQSDWESRYARWITEPSNPAFAFLTNTAIIFLALLGVFVIFLLKQRKKHDRARKNWIAELWASSGHEA